MKHFLNVALLSVGLITPIAMAPTVLRAEDHGAARYHDSQRNDDHEWNDREDRAYRMWVKEKHRKYVDFSKLRENDRQSYWDWRHEHSDAVLKLDIR